MSVILRKRKNADGSISLRLDIYHNGKRSYETLKELKLSKDSSLARESNKSLIQQAEAIRVARASELEANDYNLITNSGKKTLVLAWMQVYVDNYTKKDKRNMQGVLNRFNTFLEIKGMSNITFGNIESLLIEDFIDYLEANSKGEGASSYFNRFKKMLKQAYRKKLLKENILDFVTKKVKGKARKKDTLTIDELQILASTPIENQEIRRAFLFSCVTGLRWCDLKTLKSGDINLNNKLLNLRQNKTGEDVTIPLNETALKLIGEINNTNNIVFDLPTSNGANKTLKAWVKRAKISKSITWHNARHSFGTNLIFKNVDVLTASKLLGHTSLKQTQRYVKAAEEMKQFATDQINFIL
jgi:integrase